MAGSVVRTQEPRGRNNYVVWIRQVYLHVQGKSGQTKLSHAIK